MSEKHEGYSAEGPISKPTSTPDVGTTGVSPRAAASAENRASEGGLNERQHEALRGFVEACITTQQAIDHAIANARTFQNVSIQCYPAELDYVSAQLHGREEDDRSFLETFCWACLRADGFNYPLLRPALIAFMEKYPADPERLRIERIDSGREPVPSSNHDDVQDAAAGER